MQSSSGCFCVIVCPRSSSRSPRTRDRWPAVAMLAERQRTAIVLRYVADLKEEEIASVMGVGRSTVSTTLRDARSRLEALLNIDERADQDETEASDARPA